MTADHYVAAVPVEIMRLLAGPELRAAEPRLKRLDKLVTRWMNGVMFYLDEDVPVVHGHAIYIDSEWALTSISQRQFWRGFDFAQTGDGRVEGILSVDVSDWSTPSRRLGKIAMQCTHDEVLDEVWAQLTDHLEDLDDGNVVRAFLDPAIEFPNPTRGRQPRAAAGQHRGSWADRPDAVTRIPNLFLASDYVRTHTDLATMEGANEAARRAVNGILDATGSTAPRCEIWPLREPAAFAPAQGARPLRWKLFHRPAKPPLRVTDDGGVEATGPVAAGLRAAGPAGQAAARLSPAARAAALELRQPERLDRAERAGALDAPGGGGARRPGDEVGGERVPVAARELDLGELRAGRVVGLARRSTTRRRASCRPRGPRRARPASRPRTASASRTPGSRVATEPTSAPACIGRANGPNQPR